MRICAGVNCAGGVPGGGSNPPPADPAPADPPEVGGGGGGGGGPNPGPPVFVLDPLPVVCASLADLRLLPLISRRFFVEFL